MSSTGFFESALGNRRNWQLTSTFNESVAIPREIKLYSLVIVCEKHYNTSSSFTADRHNNKFNAGEIKRRITKTKQNVRYDVNLLVMFK